MKEPFLVSEISYMLKKSAKKPTKKHNKHRIENTSLLLAKLNKPIKTIEHLIPPRAQKWLTFYNVTSFTRPFYTGATDEAYRRTETRVFLKKC